ncbi:hypothetical protein DFH28DRAFT_924349 [Melampsora americana]|nr:hypothetical protein DFH28DRAFT_924349 [Melampsora americana]
MDNYLKDMEVVLSIFYNQLIRDLAQWVNKPKCHMLRHLKDLIKRFGPANLFMTQKFECYNGVLRAASVHSNRMSLGRDIANSFNNYQCMRVILSGNTFWDCDLGARCAAGTRVQGLLRKVPELSKALGLAPKPTKASELTIGVQVKDSAVTPAVLAMDPPSAVWDGAVLLNHGGVVAQVVAIWKPRGAQASHCVLHVCETEHGDIDPFYGMRQIIRIHRANWVKISRIHCIVNVQHNCNRDVCPVADGPKKRLERHDTLVNSSIVAHIANNHYILNSASHYSAEAHRLVANLQHDPLMPQDWSDALLKGLDTWETVPVKLRKTSVVKGKEKATEQDSSLGNEGLDGYLDGDDVVELLRCGA